MDCRTARDRLGEWLDGEIRGDLASALKAHLDRCAPCRQESQTLRRLTAELAHSGDETPPPDLWNTIAERLDRAGTLVTRRAWYRRPLAVAASLLLVVGLGVLAAALIGPGTTAEAAMIDFSLLLDGLAGDVSAAVDKFLLHYDAQPIDPTEARAFAPDLNVHLPRELPGGFQLQQAYKLQFQGHPGIAARYLRGDELLVTMAHPPIQQEFFGTHKDAPCIIGDSHGHQVQVGPWRLIHLTEKTTCHCVLTKLDVETEVPAVAAKIAPNLGGERHDHHQ